MHVLVLGGYGFIGREIVRHLHRQGHEVSALGRDAAHGRHAAPGVRWLQADLGSLAQPQAWVELLDGVDAVVNAAGVLQSGLRDDPELVQHAAVAGLVRACEAQAVRHFVQISSVGAAHDATTAFLRSKARGDAHIRVSALAWTILKPGLVLGANAYGGSAFIRMCAAVPWVQPVAMGDARVQTVSVDDVAQAVCDAIGGRLQPGAEFDLVEDEAHSLETLITVVRCWLGFDKARLRLVVPSGVMRGVARAADLLGYLGWRPPLRSTALAVLAAGVTGDPEPYRQAGGNIGSLEQTLLQLPSTLQERWFARFYLLAPLVIAVLALFWLMTGVVTLLDLRAAAAATALDVPWDVTVAALGAGVDIALGAALLYRPWAHRALAGMVVVTLAYLLGASLVRPELWMDPLGPLVKAVPALVLAVVAAVMLRNR